MQFSFFVGYLVDTADVVAVVVVIATDAVLEIRLKFRNCISFAYFRLISQTSSFTPFGAPFIHRYINTMHSRLHNTFSYCYSHTTFRIHYAILLFVLQNFVWKVKFDVEEARHKHFSVDLFALILSTSRSLLHFSWIRCIFCLWLNYIFFFVFFSHSNLSYFFHTSAFGSLFDLLSHYNRIPYSLSLILCIQCSFAEQFLSLADLKSLKWNAKFFEWIVYSQRWWTFQLFWNLFGDGAFSSQRNISFVFRVQRQSYFIDIVRTESNMKKQVKNNTYKHTHTPII